MRSSFSVSERAPVGGVVVTDVAGKLELAGRVFHQKIGELFFIPVAPGVDLEQRSDAVAQIFLVALDGGEGALELFLLLLSEPGDEEERRYRRSGESQPGQLFAGVDAVPEHQRKTGRIIRRRHRERQLRCGENLPGRCGDLTLNRVVAAAQRSRREVDLHRGRTAGRQFRKFHPLFRQRRIDPQAERRAGNLLPGRIENPEHKWKFLFLRAEYPAAEFRLNGNLTLLLFLRQKLHFTPVEKSLPVAGSHRNRAGGESVGNRGEFHLAGFGGQPVSFDPDRQFQRLFLRGGFAGSFASGQHGFPAVDDPEQLQHPVRIGVAHGVAVVLIVPARRKVERADPVRRRNPRPEDVVLPGGRTGGAPERPVPRRDAVGEFGDPAVGDLPVAGDGDPLRRGQRDRFGGGRRESRRHCQQRGNRQHPSENRHGKPPFADQSVSSASGSVAAGVSTRRIFPSTP